MSETTEKIPILSKDFEGSVVLNYSEAGSIVNAIFQLASKWDEPTVNEFKRLIENREMITDPNMVIYLHLDKLYKKILACAKQQGQIEYVDISEGLSPIG